MVWRGMPRRPSNFHSSGANGDLLSVFGCPWPDCETRRDSPNRDASGEEARDREPRVGAAVMWKSTVAKRPDGRWADRAGLDAGAQPFVGALRRGPGSGVHGLLASALMWCIRGSAPRMWTFSGSWPVLVTSGGSPRIPPRQAMRVRARVPITRARLAGRGPVPRRAAPRPMGR